MSEDITLKLEAKGPQQVLAKQIQTQGLVSIANEEKSALLFRTGYEN